MITRMILSGIAGVGIAGSGAALLVHTDKMTIERQEARIVVLEKRHSDIVEAMKQLHIAEQKIEQATMEEDK
jgi:hypothetical protein